MVSRRDADFGPHPFLLFVALQLFPAEAHLFFSIDEYDELLNPTILYQKDADIVIDTAFHIGRVPPLPTADDPVATHINAPEFYYLLEPCSAT